MDDFIGIYDDAVQPADCDAIIEHFEKLNSMNLVFGRPNGGLEIKDKQIEILQPSSIDCFATNPVFENMMKSLWNCFTQYTEKYNALSLCGDLDIKAVKLQRTDLASGYHVWHFENAGSANRTRLLVWMLYLNNVDEGGETEFLYQSKRIKPKKGTMLIWPAGFTHTHRGNPPLSGTKYIATSWIEYVH